jgi:hypothetical protein
MRYPPYHHYTLKDLAVIRESNPGTKGPASSPANLLSLTQMLTQVWVDRGRQI